MRWMRKKTTFDDASFDIAVGMFVASVVPNPKRLLAEMRRLVRPGGDILLIITSRRQKVR